MIVYYPLKLIRFTNLYAELTLFSLDKILILLLVLLKLFFLNNGKLLLLKDLILKLLSSPLPIFKLLVRLTVFTKFKKPFELFGLLFL